MKRNLVFLISALGVLAGLAAAYFFGMQRPAQPPLFRPVSSPYATAIYANGIVESLQGGGSMINIYPEVPGPVVQVMVREGQAVPAGTPLVAIDDTVQRAATEQLHAQALAAQELLNELKAQPRKETLEVARSQLVQAQANLKTAQDQYDKRLASFQLDARSISKDALDTADGALRQARAAEDVARRQLELTQAGAWVYDIRNQEKQVQALDQAWRGAKSLLGKYVLKAQADGVVLSVNAAPGSYVSTQGAFDMFSQGMLPLVVMSAPQDELAVRCFVDEILIAKLPAAGHIKAEMSIRGTDDRKVPLHFVRIQPLVSPKLELSNQRQEKVDLRVLPVIFKFSKRDVPTAYPGQLVDVYIGQQ